MNLMPALSDTGVIAVLLAVAIIVVLIGASVMIIGRMHRSVISHISDELEPSLRERLGEAREEIRDDVAARLGPVESSLGRLERRVEQVRHEVLPNNGSSLRDAVTRTEKRLCEHIEHSTADRLDLRERIADVNRQVRPRRRRRR